LLRSIILCTGILAQDEAAPPANQTPAKPVFDPVAFVGVQIEELIKRMGPPAAVYAVRGLHSWQDDVVFEYKNVDFYLFKDRVWQISLKSANGVKLGDAKMAVNMVHQEAQDKGAYIAAAVKGLSWPIEYRYYIDAKGKVAAIYLSRPDF
jgi:hypothetical protein